MIAIVIMIMIVMTFHGDHDGHSEHNASCDTHDDRGDQVVHPGHMTTGVIKMGTQVT